MIFEKIKDLIVSRTNLNENVVTMQVSLKDDLGLDSFDPVELGMESENAFTAIISDEELIASHTVRNIVTLMENNKE